MATNDTFFSRYGSVLRVSLFQGPIVGFTFGAIIKNDSLWRISVRNELIGLLICLSFG